MKKVFVALVILSFGCTTSTDPVKGFIPGTYVRHYQDEYTNSYDTLTISAITSSGSEGYTIAKRTTYQKTRDGVTYPKKNEAQEWVADYNKETKTLVVGPSGKQLYFDPSKGELKMGTMPYKKIK